MLEATQWVGCIEGRLNPALPRMSLLPCPQQLWLLLLSAEVLRRQDPGREMRPPHSHGPRAKGPRD